MILRNVSASQVLVFAACERKWWFERIGGHRSPPSVAILRGRGADEGVQRLLRGEPPATHAELVAVAARGEDLGARLVLRGGRESTLGDELAREHDWTALVRAAAPHLPDPGTPGLRVQKKVVIPTFPGGPPWIGYVDWEVLPEVWDLKTTTDFRYCKTPEELGENPQMNSYAKALFDEVPEYEGSLCVAHLYVETFSPGEAVPARGSATKVVSRDVTRGHVEEVWRRDVDRARRMVTVSAITWAEDVPPTGAARGECDAFGGCPHRARCGFELRGAAARLVTLGTKTTRKGDAMGFAEKLAAKKAELAAAQAAAGGSGGQPGVDHGPRTPAIPRVPTGVLAPDAAPRASAGGEPQPNVPERPKRGRKRGPAADAVPDQVVVITAAADADARRAESSVADDRVSAPATTSEADLAAAIKKVHEVGRVQAGGAVTLAPAGFTLYQDCCPTKGSPGAVMFSDWFAPVEAAMNAEALRRYDAPHYMLLPFGDQKALLARCVGGALGTLPAELVVDSSAPGARDALGVLVPHARVVVRGLRG